MKKIKLLPFVLLLLLISCEREVLTPENTYPNFNDRIFYAYCLDNFDANYDEKVSCAEVNKIKELDVTDLGIISLSGLESFTSLETLICANNKINELDLSKCSSLKYLNCELNYLSALNLESCTRLTVLDCNSNFLKTLDLRKNSELTTVICNSNELEKLDISTCKMLQYVNCGSNQITDLNVSNCTSLKRLDCGSNALTFLDVSTCKNLTNLRCKYNQKLTTIYLNKGQAIASLNKDNNTMTLYK